MRQVSDEKILEKAHRICWKYRHTDEAHYQFNDITMLQFARSILNEAADSKEHVNMMTVCAYEAGSRNGLMHAQCICEEVKNKCKTDDRIQLAKDCIDAIQKELDIS